MSVLLTGVLTCLGVWFVHGVALIIWLTWLILKHRRPGSLAEEVGS